MALEFSSNKKLLGAPGIATRSVQTLLGAPGHTTMGTRELRMLARSETWTTRRWREIAIGMREQNASCVSTGQRFEVQT